MRKVLLAAALTMVIPATAQAHNNPSCGELHTLVKNYKVHGKRLPAPGPVTCYKVGYRVRGRQGYNMSGPVGASSTFHAAFVHFHYGCGVFKDGCHDAIFITSYYPF